MGYWTDHQGWSETSTSQNHGNSSTGVGFQFQDRVKVQSTTFSTYTLSYLGKGFSATVTYGPDFANFHGKAKTFYSHTWNSTYIQSVNLSVSSSPGFNVVLANGGNGFTIYNNSDTNF